MNGGSRLHPDIDLFVQQRISHEDAERQLRTASEILSRLEQQPGLILADGVGMGKTFVALAVAISVTLGDKGRRPVVVMVPGSVKDKWPSDFEIFREHCLPPHLAQTIDYASASRPVEFFKLLNDPAHRRKSLIFLTHGAMNRRIRDPFAKLAIIRQALKYRRDVQSIRRSLSRFAGDLLSAGWLTKRDPEIWGLLLDRPPDRWLNLLRRRDVGRPDDETSLSDDDPVPAHLVDALSQINTDSVYEALKLLPIKHSVYYQERMQAARNAINSALNDAWTDLLRHLRLRLPLLVLDEAHHLKNAGTQLASLFEGPEAAKDIEEITGGALGGLFERMLFLTATPFQLGHHELCNILERFKGVAWRHNRAPSGGLSKLEGDIATLRSKLDSAQEAALRLEQSWSRLTAEDLQVDGTLYQSPRDWWHDAEQSNGLTPAVQQAKERIDHARQRLRDTEEILRPWIIRHTRPQHLPKPFHDTSRRTRLVGGAILTDESAVEATSDKNGPGIPIDGDSALPFLLAARLVACTPESRPVFAEGLSSSYEAFLDTRRARQARETPVDEEDHIENEPTVGEAGQWYLDQITESIAHSHDEITTDHPKLGATVRRAMDLWRRGEKVLIFCHYIATGRALREAISTAVDRHVTQRVSEQLDIPRSQVFDNLERITARLDKGEPAARACIQQVDNLLQGHPALEEHRDRIHDIVLRFLRRPSFIIRYIDLTNRTITPDEVEQSFHARDESGLSIRQVVENFLNFLENRCGQVEREHYLEAVETIQTGVHYGREVIEDDDTSSSRAFVGNVRLINGATKHGTRQRLMLAFNTPFYPEILVTSSVMAEGVDLHLNCRHIIHHDLAWNPSNIEQRTGRIDRIGAKAEYAGKPIIVYLPYIAETQDEKMYRVVIDRESWFNVVMGGTLPTDARSTDKIADRIPLPERVQETLTVDLSLR